jgi:hypothetical protein
VNREGKGITVVRGEGRIDGMAKRGQGHVSKPKKVSSKAVLYALQLRIKIPLTKPKKPEYASGGSK